MSTVAEVLDCGHRPTETSTSFTNGVAHSPDGKRSMCYACADSEIAAGGMYAPLRLTKAKS